MPQSVTQLKHRRLVYAPVFASCVISIVLLYSGWLTPFENGLDEIEADLSRSQYPSDMVVVEVDHTSLRALPAWPWPRPYYAQAIDHLLQAQVNHIFLDIDFSTESNPRDDDILAETLSKSSPGTILMPMFLQYANNGNSKYLTLSKPNKKFSDYVTPVSVNITPDDDGLVRRFTVRSRFAGENIPTAAMLLTGYPAATDESARLNFRIMPNSFQRISFHDIYNNNFDPEAVRNKNIIIGATALELSDQIAVPVYRSLAGPVVQALSYQTLNSGSLIQTSQYVTGFIILLLLYPAWFMFYASGWRKGLWRLSFSNALILASSLILYAGFNVLIDTIALILFLSLSYTFYLFSKIDRQLYRIFKQDVALNEKDKMMAHVIRNSNEGIVILNDTLTIQSVNAAACKIFHAIESELNGMPINQLLPDVDFSQISEYQKNRIETDAIQDNENRLPVELAMNKIRTNDEDIYIRYFCTTFQNAKRSRKSLIIRSRMTH